MKKIAVILLAISVSATAQADYFACQISQGGSVLASVEAEYRVLNASVESDGFVCEGRINGRNTDVKLSVKGSDYSVENSELGGSAEVSMSTVPRHNELDIYCSCGMQ